MEPVNVANQIAKKIKESMVENKLKKISVEYYGSGDSGEIENIEFSPDFEDVNNTFENLFWDLIEDSHSGFEINDGGGGEIVAVIKKGELTLSHDYYDFVESKSSAPVIKI